METIKRLFFKFMLLASTHCTMVVGVDAHFTIAPSLNLMHPYIEVGREIERFATGGIRISTDYNEMGLVSSRHVHSGERHTGWRHYRWDVGARLLSMRCSMRQEPVIYAYDEMCSLIRGEYSLLESIFRTPDKVGNLYRESECKGRRYDRGGRLLWDGEYHYAYDCEGNLVHKSRRDIMEALI